MTTVTPCGSCPKTKTGTPAVITENILQTYPCDDILDAPLISTTSSCADQKKGKIFIEYESTIGVPPFQYSIDEGKTFSSQSTFIHLNPATYTVIVKDSRGCKSKSIEALVEKENCNSIIYPDQQKYWEPPIERLKKLGIEEDVLLKITNGKSAIIVYQQRISATTPFVWTGLDKNNTPLPMGNYIYEIFTNDPSQIITGQITVVR